MGLSTNGVTRVVGDLPAARGEARADDAPGGSAVTPAVGRHDGLTVGVLAGRAPRRSAAVRTALVEALQTGLVDDTADPLTPASPWSAAAPATPS